MKLCPRCGNENLRVRAKYCSDKCSHQHDDKTKLLLSEKRKQYLKDNPDKHVWKRHTKFKSIPCEHLKKYLTSKGLVFIEEWQPLQSRFYSIDIAFPDIKLGIEVNGNQHYDSSGNLKEYYKLRHDEIEASGWTLIELHYSSCYNIELINKIIDIKFQPDYTEYFKIAEERKIRKIKRTKKEIGESVRNKTDLKWNPYKNLILTSNIDFTKFGWVSKVSEILSIKPQKVNGWMKRYLPHFYEEKCFKRASVSSPPSKRSLTM